MKINQVHCLKAGLWLAKYLIYSLPLVIGAILWIYLIPSIDGTYSGLLGVIWDILGWHFMIWFCLVVLFFVQIIFWRKFRETILEKITRSEEHDERESFIAGRASKATFYSTLAFLIFMFFLSGLNINLHKKADSEVMDGKKHTLTIGFGFGLTKSDDNKDGDQNSIITYKGMPLTVESLLLLLIILHIGSYHIFKRKYLGG